jgi:hypothetical protein
MDELKGRELDAKVAEVVMGLPKREIPAGLSKFGHVDPSSDLWRDIIERAMEAGVVLAVNSAYKGAHYGADFDGWHLSYSIPYADAYKADDELRMSGTVVEEWTHGFEPGVYISVADTPRYSSDIANAWAVIEKLIADHPTWFPEVHENRVQHYCKIWKNNPMQRDAFGWLAIEYGMSTPEAICKAALAAKGRTNG